MFMFAHYLSSELRQTVNQLNNCEDILMNFLVSDISKYPPIKITQRKAYKDSMVNPSSSINKQGGVKWQSSYHFAQRQVSTTLESLLTCVINIYIRNPSGVPSFPPFITCFMYLLQVVNMCMYSSFRHAWTHLLIGTGLCRWWSPIFV